MAIWILSIVLVILLGLYYSLYTKYKRIYKAYLKELCQKTEVEKQKIKVINSLHEASRVLYCISLFLYNIHKESPDNEKVNDLLKEIRETEEMIIRSTNYAL